MLRHCSWLSCWATSNRFFLFCHLLPVFPVTEFLVFPLLSILSHLFLLYWIWWIYIFHHILPPNYHPRVSSSLFPFFSCHVLLSLYSPAITPILPYTVTLPCNSTIININPTIDAIYIAIAFHPCSTHSLYFLPHPFFFLSYTLSSFLLFLADCGWEADGVDWLTMVFKKKEFVDKIGRSGRKDGRINGGSEGWKGSVCVCCVSVLQ